MRTSVVEEAEVEERLWYLGDEIGLAFMHSGLSQTHRERFGLWQLVHRHHSCSDRPRRMVALTQRLQIRPNQSVLNSFFCPKFPIWR